MRKEKYYNMILKKDCDQYFINDLKKNHITKSSGKLVS